THQATGIFHGINGPFRATRYHSLVVGRAGMPQDLTITAESEGRLVMGLAHKRRPAHGGQFHPESIASAHGRPLLRHELDIPAAWNGATGRRKAPARASH